MKIVRRPTPEEARERLLEIVERMCRVADEFNRVSRIDIHRKNAHVGYLMTEAANIRSWVERSERLLPAPSMADDQQPLAVTPSQPSVPNGADSGVVLLALPIGV
jgi:hypothetical protein